MDSDEKPFISEQAKDRLFISDLDGTLLNDQGKLSASSLEKLNHLIDSGLKFTIATARSRESAMPLLQGLRLKLPAVFFNGVFITDLSSGEDLPGSEFISREIIIDMLDAISPQSLEPFIYTVSGKHNLYYRRTNNPGAQNYLDSLNGDGRLNKVKAFHFGETERIAGFLLIDSMDKLEPVYLDLKKNFNDKLAMYFAKDLYSNGFYWLQTYSKQATKGQAVRKLSKHLNIPLSQITVFGDYLNDLDMFEAADHSIAVKNALPEVSAQADETIGTNNEGAVIDYLESLASL